MPTFRTFRFVLAYPFIVAAILLGGLFVGFAQERAVLTAPTVQTTTITDYQILSVTVQRAAMGYDWKLRIAYLDNLGNEYVDEDTGATAEPLVKGLNTANLSVKSLERRAMERLIAKGKIPAAAIIGVPQ